MRLRRLSKRSQRKLRNNPFIHRILNTVTALVYGAVFSFKNMRKCLKIKALRLVWNSKKLYNTMND